MGCCDPDEESKRDITAERRCTDVCWLCLFIAFWCLMVIVAAFSFVYGNPIRLINGFDSFGNTCGSNTNKKIGNLEYSGLDTSDKPHLLFFDINELRNSLKICVKKCPTKTFRKVEDLGQYYRQTKIGYCNYNFNYDDLNKPNQKWGSHVLSASYGPCPMMPVYESTPVLNRCVPKPVKEVSDAILSNIYGLLNNWDTLEKVLADLYTSKYVIIGLVFLSLFLSLFTISILHIMAHVVSYIIMILFTISSIGGTAFLWYTYFDIKHNLDHTRQSMWLWESARNEDAFFWYSIVATVITVIILLIVIVMRKQVGFLADLFQETAKCLGHIPALFFQPLVTFVVLLIFFIFWISVVLCLATSYHPDMSGISMSFSEDKTTFTTASTVSITTEKPMGNLSFADKVKKLTLVEYIDPAWVKYMWWIYFIGLIWTSEFIMACQQMVIAGAVAHWFYRHKFTDNSHVTYGLSKLMKYHLGSVAFGSFIITLFKIPRLILTYLHEKLKYQENKGSECASCCLKCCICCFYCMEKFIRYLNHNAYTVIAIDGVGFCKAAGTAFEVLTSHALQVATINGLGDFILFLGKCFVTALTGSVGLLIFRKNTELTFYAVPTLVVCIFAFFVAHCILSLYEMVLDTVYLCIAQNGEAPDGIQMQNMGVTFASNGNTTNPASELEPIK